MITPIPDYETYGIDEECIVYDLRSGKTVPQHNDASGYKKVNLRNPQGDKNMAVHRACALAFIPNPENKPEVDHINRIHTDNRLANLRWVNRPEQMENRKGWSGTGHKYIHLDKPNGKKSPYQGWRVEIKNLKCNKKLRYRCDLYTLEQVLEIRNKILNEHNIPILD